MSSTLLSSSFRHRRLGSRRWCRQLCCAVVVAIVGAIVVVVAIIDVGVGVGDVNFAIVVVSAPWAWE